MKGYAQYKRVDPCPNDNPGYHYWEQCGPNEVNCVNCDQVGIVIVRVEQGSDA